MVREMGLEEEWRIQLLTTGQRHQASGRLWEAFCHHQISERLRKGLFRFGLGNG